MTATNIHPVSDSDSDCELIRDETGAKVRLVHGNLVSYKFIDPISRGKYSDLYYTKIYLT